MSLDSGIAFSSPAYPLLIEQVLKNRFYHGYSHHTLGDNWIAVIGEKLFGHALSCTVYSNDILQYNYAACSQQAMVMMDLLKQKNIPCRHVGFQHHYALEAQINSQWYFFDPNMEPQISFEDRAHHLWAGNANYLKQFYKGRYSNDSLDYNFGMGVPAHFGSTNEATAPNAKLFNTITRPISLWGWLLPLLLLLSWQHKSYGSFIYTILARQKASNYLYRFYRGKLALTDINWLRV
jgi:hypothetical protein